MGACTYSPKRRKVGFEGKVVAPAEGNPAALFKDRAKINLSSKFQIVSINHLSPKVSPGISGSEVRRRTGCRTEADILSYECGMRRHLLRGNC